MYESEIAELESFTKTDICLQLSLDRRVFDGEDLTLISKFVVSHEYPTKFCLSRVGDACETRTEPLVESPEGLIVKAQPYRQMHRDPYAGKNRRPTCIAIGRMYGIGDPGGDCGKCPYARSPCRERTALFVLNKAGILEIFDISKRGSRAMRLLARDERRLRTANQVGRYRLSVSRETGPTSELMESYSLTETDRRVYGLVADLCESMFVNAATI